MKYQEFMNRLQDYYGPYQSRGNNAKGEPIPTKVPSYVLAYLKRDIAEDKLDQLFRYVTYYHPVRFGPPGISDIEKAAEQARYKGKGSDVHKGPPEYKPPAAEMPTPEEKAEADRLIQESGGLQKMFKNLLRERRFEDPEEEQASGW